ncbi:MAG: hypothetical protein NC340_01815 [Ruminococcus flavefaciens]|nr:hypothetical protein [Ruminococcus flavefaciens]MCM1228884.1 hypothetical protein [Ruminococcus flavefaciens]
MSKYNIRIDSYFKEQIMDRGETISSACDTLISEIPTEVIDKLSAMSLDDAKKYIDYVYADFDSTKNTSENAGLSVRLSVDLDLKIDKLSYTWKKASKSDIIKVLLAIGIMYQDHKLNVLKQSKSFSFRTLSLSTKTSPPYVCYQHGNKDNPKMKAEITKILKQIPEDIQTVVEPCMGMCGITINVLDTLSDRKLNYYVNDKDNNLFRLYDVISKNYKKLLLSCKNLINNLNTGTDDFKSIRNRHLDNNYDNDYDASADYMYLDAVSVRHDKQTLKSDYKSIDKQINVFNKYIFNVRAMHDYLIKTSISHKDIFKMLKKFKNNKEIILYLLDTPYLLSQGYSKKTNGVDEFTYEHHKKMVSFCKNISPDSIFLLFCRFTSTRSLKKGETSEDIKIKEQNGYFEVDDRILRGFYKREFGVETGNTKHKFFYKEIEFDSQGTVEVIISNVQFHGFKPF